MIFDCSSSSWYDAPDLNEGRMRHASIVVNNCVFVIGGINPQSLRPTGSVERLELAYSESPAWTLLVTRSTLCMRSDASIIAASEDEIVVFGGFDHGDTKVQGYTITNTGIVFEVNSVTAKPILGQSSDFRFMSRTQTQTVSDGKCITLGCDNHCAL